MNLKQTTQYLQSIASGLDDILNGKGIPAKEKKMGFALLVFEFDQSPITDVNYVSNAKREDMITAINSWLARQKGQTQ